jgi:hypothetical protein
MTGDFRHCVSRYASKVNPLQQRKTQLLKASPVKEGDIKEHVKCTVHSL